MGRKSRSGGRVSKLDSVLASQKRADAERREVGTRAARKKPRKDKRAAPRSLEMMEDYEAQHHVGSGRAERTVQRLTKGEKRCCICIPRRVCLGFLLMLLLLAVAAGVVVAIMWDDVVDALR